MGGTNGGDIEEDSVELLVNDAVDVAVDKSVWVADESAVKESVVDVLDKPLLSTEVVELSVKETVCVEPVRESVVVVLKKSDQRSESVDIGIPLLVESWAKPRGTKKT